MDYGTKSEINKKFLTFFFILENPRPEHGPIVLIKLNEAEEILTTPNGQQHRVIGELYFQMNYTTGEYQKIKKFKQLTTN